MVYECSTSQYDHLRDSNISDIYTIKIDDIPLGMLNEFLTLNGIPCVYELSKENEDEHKSFKELASEECIELIRAWAEDDFVRYGYER